MLTFHCGLFICIDIRLAVCLTQTSMPFQMGGQFGMQQHWQALMCALSSIGTVRRDGSYIYEEFLATGGTDVKVSAISSCTSAASTMG